MGFISFDAPKVETSLDIGKPSKYWVTKSTISGDVVIGILWELPKNPQQFDMDMEMGRKKALDQGWILATWYSEHVYYGEIGYNCISECTPIPKYLFDYLLEIFKP